MDAMTPNGVTETFVVRLTAENSGIWRGNIICVGSQAQQNFSSLQELLRLMDSALAQKK